MQTNKPIPGNMAMLSFGPKKAVNVLTLFCKTYPDLPLVSVGSGMGIVERATSTRVKNEFILVDPAPNSYFKLPYFDEVIARCGMLPHYAYTKDLLLKRPELADVPASCILLLNWCNHGEDDYDLEAIRLLRPRAIFAIISVAGSAGSKQFHAYLKEEACLYKPLCVYQIADPHKEKYACAHVTTSMQWLVDRDAPAEPHKRSVVCLQKHDDSNQRNIVLLGLDKKIARDKALRNVRNTVATLAEDKTALRETVMDEKKREELLGQLSLLGDMFTIADAVKK